jgi:hypothetical protein
MRTPVAIACLGLLLGIAPATGQSAHPLITHELTVSHHRSIHVSAEQVRDILKRMSSDLLGGCGVAFKLVGEVEPFASPDTPHTISDKDDLEAVHREPAKVKGVKAIDFCKRDSVFEGEFIGCSWRPAPRGRLRTMIVTQVEPAGLRPILWAHEFGHTRGLRHRRIPEALMTPCTLFGDNVQVTTRECSCFRKDAGGCRQAYRQPLCGR